MHECPNMLTAVQLQQQPFACWINYPRGSLVLARGRKKWNEKLWVLKYIESESMFDLLFSPACLYKQG